MTQGKEQEFTSVPTHLPRRSYTGAFVTIAILIAFLFVTNLYTLATLTSAKHNAENVQSALRKEIGEIKTQNLELVVKYSVLRGVQADQVDELRRELDIAAKRLGAVGPVLDRARAMAIAFQRERAREAGEVEGRLAEKADADDVTALGESFSVTQSALSSTKRSVDVLAKDLGAARSELGGMMSQARDQIATLHQLGDRDYQEFILIKDRAYRIGHVDLLLKKTDVKKQRFNLNLIANDQEIQNKGRNVFEPIFFYAGRVRVPYEVVITGVGSESVAGYIRIPKADSVDVGFAPQT